ncbi:MAG: HlyD family efflux transporter periplasmic adaptor subunit [Caldilineaceae bacterium]
MFELQDDFILIRKRRRRRRRLIWGVILLLLLGGAGYYGYLTYFPAQQTAAPVTEATLATATARRGDLVLSVDGVGNLLPTNEMRLGFGTSGTLLTLAVQPGDVITKGQILATLDDTEARYQVLQAGIGLRQAQLQLNELTAPAATNEIASSRAALAAADASLQELTVGPSTDELAAAQNDLLSAQQAPQRCSTAPVDEELVLRADLRSAEIVLQQAQSAYNQIAWRSDVGTSSQAADLQNATIAYERVLAQTNINAAGAEPQDISSARARVSQARETLNALQAEPNALTLLERQARVEEAQANLDALLNGPDAATFETSNLNLQQAQQALDNAMLALEGAVIRAPFNGVVTVVDTQVGEQAGTGGVMTVAEAASSQVRFWVEELDAANVKVGRPVNSIIEAFPDFTFTGTVARIEPTLVTVDGATAAQVWATIDTTQHPVTLLYGMNAEVEVIAGEARNAVLVPIAALRELVAGTFAVFVVLPDGELELRLVDVGLRDFINAEIRSGVEAGETVSTGDSQTP